MVLILISASISRKGANFDEGAHKGAGLHLVVATLGKSVFNLAHAVNQEHLHLVGELCDHQLLVNFTDDVIESQTLACLELHDELHRFLEWVVCERVVYRLDICWRGSASYLVDFLKRDVFVRKRA